MIEENKRAEINSYKPKRKEVEFLGEDEDGSGRVSFDYDLLFTPETVNLDEQKQEIEQTIAAVLREILEATVRNGDINEIGDIDSEQPSE